MSPGGAPAEPFVRNRRNLLPVLALSAISILVSGSITVRTASAATDEVPLDKFFKGAVIGLDGNKLKLRYDFATKDQATDWPEGVVFRLIRQDGDGVGLAEGKYTIRGSTGIHHIGEWEGDLTVTAKLIPDGIKDIGSWLGSNDQPDDCVTYTLGEKYFHAWDNKSGGDTGMMKFGREYSATAKAGFVGFRYLQFRHPKTDPVAGKPVVWSYGRKSEKVFLTMDDMSLESVEPPNKLKTLTAGFYAVQSSMAVDDIVIEGTLSAKFIANKKIALRTERPIVTDVGGGIDLAVQGEIDAYKKNPTNPTKLVQIIGDAARPEPDRIAAATAIKAGPHSALTTVRDLLYNGDVKVRAMGLDIVKGITGKSYGYDPKASEKARGLAVRRLNDDIEAHPELLQGGGG
jgi:hypothetical protein